MKPRDNIEQILHGWSPVRIGRQVIWLDETASTNLAALERADQPDADGLVVLADFQSAGRGRLGRQWLSPRGASVLCSVVLLDSAPAEGSLAGRLNMAAAVAACEAVAQSTEIRPAIKWPNDLRIAGKKVGGILVETRALQGTQRAYVIGFGINALQHAGHFPPDIREQATSLDLAASHAVDRLALVRALLQSLDARLSSPDWLSDPQLHGQWLSFAEPIGSRITLRLAGTEFSGTTVEVDPLGGLTVRLDNGRPMWFDPMLTSVV